MSADDARTLDARASELRSSAPGAAAPDLAGASPVIAQFLEMKAQHPDCLLFFRMGDFYELFFDDAGLAAEALGIALTKRGKHAGEDIPMCGVPIHNAERYLHELIRKGFRVAVAEQMEDPAEARKRGSKSVVRREVVRLVTPGTLTEDALLERDRHNYLAAFAETRGRGAASGALAWADVSTGDLFVAAAGRAELPSLLARVAAAEVIAKGPAESSLRDMVEETGAALTETAPAGFASDGAAVRAARAFGAATLDSFGEYEPAEAAAIAALIDYLDLTQRGKLPLLKPPQRESRTAMRIDAATRRNLELARSLSGEREGSLLSVLDRTRTSAGARLLEARLASPLTDVAAISRRQDAVAFLLDARELREDLRRELKRAPDLERALSRLAIGRGGPRDLGALRQGLQAAAGAALLLSDAGGATPAPEAITETGAGLVGLDALIAALERVLVEEPPFRLSDGGAVADGVDAALDQARALRDRSRQVIAELQGRYQQETGLTALKVKHNSMLGYFVETPGQHAAKMTSAPLNETFIHRQTMANAMRFSTAELSDLESRIAAAADEAAGHERRLIEALTAQALEAAEAISRAAGALAALDVAASMALIAETEDWRRPVVEPGRAFAVEDGRHPVVEAALKRSGEGGFVANNCDLSADVEGATPIWLLTGPNMAGKSTFLRQNALIAVLAQMGGFVPARAARIGVVDQLFSRVGASDDLARGRSTFMVEMVETAAILHQAGPNALVILDEIGRGTATFDGLSIAWATLEHLAEKNDCRALFATHYHELTALGASLPGMKNVTVSVREWKGDVVFLREIVAGAADRSYGVQVARLAGMPGAVVERAKAVLHMLEQGEDSAAARAQRLVDDLPLFQAAEPAPSPSGSAVEERLGAIDPDAVTPREALDMLYELRALLEREE